MLTRSNDLLGSNLVNPGEKHDSNVDDNAAAKALYCGAISRILDNDNFKSSKHYFSQFFTIIIHVK